MRENLGDGDEEEESGIGGLVEKKADVRGKNGSKMGFGSIPNRSRKKKRKENKKGQQLINARV